MSENILCSICLVLRLTTINRDSPRCSGGYRAIRLWGRSNLNSESFILIVVAVLFSIKGVSVKGWILDNIPSPTSFDKWPQYDSYKDTISNRGLSTPKANKKGKNGSIYLKRCFYFKLFFLFCWFCLFEKLKSIILLFQPFLVYRILAILAWLTLGYQSLSLENMTVQKIQFF